MPQFSRYLKGVTGYVGLALTYASMYYGTNHWVALAVAVASGMGIIAVPNAPKASPPEPPAPTGM